MIVALLITIGFGLAEAGSSDPVLQAPPDPKIIRIYVQTDDGGDAEELAARRESVRHLQAAISEKKKANISSTTNADEADVILEVDGRSVTVPKIVIGLSPGMGSPNSRPGGAGGPVKSVKLTVTVTIARDADPIELHNKNRANETESGWKSAADDVVKQVEKWIGERRAAIIAARGR
jgi:hypothetical protein